MPLSVYRTILTAAEHWAQMSPGRGGLVLLDVRRGVPAVLLPRPWHWPRGAALDADAADRADAWMQSRIDAHGLRIGASVMEAFALDWAAGLRVSLVYTDEHGTIDGRCARSVCKRVLSSPR